MGSSSSRVTLPSGVQTSVNFKSRRKLHDNTLAQELEVVPTEIEDCEVFFMKKFFQEQETMHQAEKTIKHFSSLLSQHVSQMFELRTESSTMSCTNFQHSLTLFGESFPCSLEKEIEHRQLLPEQSEYKYLDESEGLYIFEVITATFILFKAQDINPLYYQTKHIMIDSTGTVKVLNPVFLKHGILADPMQSFKMPGIYPIEHNVRTKLPSKADSSVVWLIGILVLCAMSNTLEEEIYLECFEISLEKIKESIQVVHEKISETLGEMLAQCLAVNPADRPSLPSLYAMVKQAMENQNLDDSMEQQAQTRNLFSRRLARLITTLMGA